MNLEHDNRVNGYSAHSFHEVYIPFTEVLFWIK